MALTRTQRAAQRLKEVDAAYRAKHVAAHNVFRAHYYAMLNKHGLPAHDPQDVMTFHSLPTAFHEDVADAKKTLIASLRQADMERNHAARAERPKLKIVRAMR